ncbi:MAG: hypothetical protein DRO12_02685 [Thermoprotei archaeon]|nr:MAG: hypothetical protein DRO12_02685 [Thermoprotei archaeon]
MVRGTVSIVHARERYAGTREALNLIKDEVREVYGSRTKVLVKPNFVSVYRNLCATHVKTVEAILDFLYEKFAPSEIVIAESPAIGSVEEGFRNYGYYELRRKYPGIEFADLDSYNQKMFRLKDENGDVYEVYVSEILLDDRYFRVSPCRAKTHDTVIVTLTIKNVVMGSIKRGYKSRMHRGYYTINYNIAALATKMMPHLGVVDGVEGMEGDGPVRGDPKPWGVIFASTNPVNLDAVVAYAMGFNPGDIGYLYFLAKWGYGEIDVRRIPRVGENLEGIRTSFRPHRMYSEQLTWKKLLGLELGFVSS